MNADARAPAVVRAEDGTEAWQDVARHQRWATPDHADIYALAADVVGTLYALDDLATVLSRQVANYGRDGNLYDDTRHVDPADRLTRAVAALDIARDALKVAAAQSNTFWSEIGHIGVEDPT